MMAGCAIHKDDARLQGTWLLNRAEAAAGSSKGVPLRHAEVSSPFANRVLAGGGDPPISVHPCRRSAGG